MRSLISTVCHKSTNVGELFYDSVVNIIKGDTVMDVAGGDFRFQNYTMGIAGSMGFIGELLFVVALDKQTTLRVGGTDGYGFRFCLLFTLFQLLFGGVVPFLFGRHRRFVIIFVILKRLLTVGFPVGVHLVHKLTGVSLCGNGNLLFHGFF